MTETLICRGRRPQLIAVPPGSPARVGLSDGEVPGEQPDLLSILAQPGPAGIARVGCRCPSPVADCG